MSQRLSKYNRLTNQLWAKSYAPLASHRHLCKTIADRANQLTSLADGQISECVQELKSRVNGGVPILDLSILVDCFALTFEAVRRTTTLSYYQVQLLAGLALAAGAIAEMKTGEGKTIVAALPATLHALKGEGVHVATVNSYLAERDHELLLPAYTLLGMSIGLLKEKAKPDEKRSAYACDITYGTGYEFGFDYLRDQSSLRRNRKSMLGQSFRQSLRGVTNAAQSRMQRGHAFAVIDEIDSVLIDEANTPLVLSGSAEAPNANTEGYRRAAELATELEEGEHFTIDQRQRTIQLTELGQEKIFQSREHVPDTGLIRPWSTYVEQALRASQLLKRDVDYVVQDGKVMIVDQYTGRIFADRTWRDGLHQAVEFREAVEVTSEKNSLARVSRQRYFGLYDRLCGMTGTASGHESELQQFYQLPVVIIPERRKNQRQSHKTRYFPSTEAKWQAIAADIQARHTHGQPVLVGTRTIRESEAISDILRQLRVPHKILNGTQTEDEADIVAHAGAAGSIVIATNMAGRGTDIHTSDEVCRLGGLHVIATERQESKRIDRQLIGRSARQGKPGSCQFFVSADDELITQHGPEVGNRLAKAGRKHNESFENLDRTMDGLQQRAELQSYEARCNLYRQDQWLNEVLSTVAEVDKPAEAVAAG